MNPRRCKDCFTQGIAMQRPAPYSGPRCATHHRVFKKAQKTRRHETHVQKTYDLPEGHYDCLVSYQDGVCFICRKPSLVRYLAVDHDHETGRVRGLLCRRCNRDLLGLYTPEMLLRAVEYLKNPPYDQMLSGTGL